MTSSAESSAAVPLRIDELSYRFDRKPVLNKIGFALRLGEMAVLLGRNGAGKSTLFSLILRLYAHREGHIRIFGRDLSATPARCLQKIGIVFQQRTLDPELTVYQNLRYHCMLHALSRADTQRRIGEELEQQQLSDRLHTKVGELSGGMTRRVEIARAMLHRPGLLLMDECTAGLDEESRRVILSYTARLCRESATAVLWATHLLDEIQPEHRLLILDRGNLLSDMTAAETLQHCQAPDIFAAFTKLVGLDVKPVSVN